MRKSNHAVFTYGRMNPPTSGHHRLVSKTIDHANSVGGDHHIFVSHSQDSRKNPLSGYDRSEYVKHAFKGANVQASDKNTAGPVQIAKHLHSQGYKHLTMVAGSDRVDGYNKLLNQYNGKEYNFDSIKVVSAGNRDDSSHGVSGISGTKMRAMAVSGDREGFKKNLMPGLQKKADEIYKKVRGALGIKEGKSMSESVNKMIPVLLMNEEQRLALIELTEDENFYIQEKSFQLRKDIALVEKYYRQGVREWLAVKKGTSLTREQYASAVVNRVLAENRDPLRTFNSWRRTNVE